MNKRNNTECHLCGAEPSCLVFLYDFGDRKVIQCSKCGVVMRNQIFSHEEIIALYNTSYFTDWQQNYFFNEEAKVADFSERIEDIEKLYPHKGRMLDIGCAIGTFLDVCNKRGWEVYGQDVSLFAAEKARAKHSDKIFHGELHDAHYGNNYFDVVTLWDVLEHLEEPIILLQEIYRVLKSGGLVVIQTDMEDSFIYKLAHFLYKLTFGFVIGPVATGHPIHHATFYSLDTLMKTINKAGFKVIKKERVPFPSSLVSISQKGIIHKLLFSAVNTFGNLIGRPLEAVVYGKK